ncbi:cutinase-domain-containing protein [Mycena crocata]|nr:cutinase-domain-containing protein [Mycena crocata]
MSVAYGATIGSGRAAPASGPSNTTETTPANTSDATVQSNITERAVSSNTTQSAIPANATEYQLSGECRKCTFIFARGTTEDGNVGARIGPPLIAELRAALGTKNIAAQGVNYTADFEGAFSGGDEAGSIKMANLIATAANKCPSTKIVVSGYSQGAQLVHKATRRLNKTVAVRINAVALFGDPYYPTNKTVDNVPADQTISFCHENDVVCNPAGGDLFDYTDHLNYNRDAKNASKFILAHLNLKATSAESRGDV